MAPPAEAVTQKAAECSDSPSVWVWLVMPLAIAALLVAIPRISTEFYMTWIEDEKTGVLQFIHWVIPLCGFVIAGQILMMRRKVTGPVLKIWLATIALGCLFIAGEEVNWGQHFLGWATPGRWTELNAQAETNLHNASSWFNEKPRLLIELGIVIGGILIPILARWRPEIYNSRVAIILPPVICIPTAVLVEFSRLVERIRSIFGFDFYLFYRASEVQETYIYIFILLYLITLRRRLAAFPMPSKAGFDV